MKTHIGHNIARIRSFRRIPQKDMAIRLGISQQDYSRIEKKQEVEEDLLERIAKELEVPVEVVKEMEASTSIQTVYQQNGNNGIGFNINDKSSDIYERLLKEKDAVIEMQRELIEQLKANIRVQE